MASRAKAKGAGDGADSGGEKSPPQDPTPSQNGSTVAASVDGTSRGKNFSDGNASIQLRI